MVDPVLHPVDKVVPPAPFIKGTIREQVIPKTIQVLEPFFLLSPPVVSFPAAPLPPFGTGVKAESLPKLACLLQLPLAFLFCRPSSGGSPVRGLQFRLELVDKKLVTRIFLATTFPGDDDELLTKKQLAEPLQLPCFLEFLRQPVLDIVLHPLRHHLRTAQREGDEEADDHHDQQAVGKTRNTGTASKKRRLHGTVSRREGRLGGETIT